MKKKISIISHDLSKNCLGRAYILAKVLADDYEVEIIGPTSNDKIWNPILSDTSVVYKKMGKIVNPVKFYKAVDGDIIYSIKPRTVSFGFALIVKILKRKKLVLDIDDWEVGFMKDFSLIGIIYSVLRFWRYDNVIFTWFLEKLIPFADAITVSNTFLQKKFGGSLIPHFRDTNIFDPKKISGDEIRREIGADNKKIVMFLGTLDKYKGIDTLISAFDLMNDKNVVLVLVGVKDGERKKIPSRNYLKIFGMQPFEKIPEFLAAADIITIMQKQNALSTQGQLPAKLFDAMSMEKPIIATRVSDIPSVLDGCGIVINDNIKELTMAIDCILNNHELAKKLGVAARLRCIEKYSYEAIRPQLVLVFSNLLNK
jgi:glycosyltransferase involved in cell wall biosynthesis